MNQKRVLITGAMVCQAITTAAGLDEFLWVKDIETLCSRNCLGLGELWALVQASGARAMTVRKLVEELINADQVINLDIELVARPECRLCVDDGDLVENTFGSIDESR